MTAIQARLNGFRDNKGGSVIIGQCIEGNSSVYTPNRVTSPRLEGSTGGALTLTISIKIMGI